jgi:hypothetical protein
LITECAIELQKSHALEAQAAELAHARDDVARETAAVG